LVHTHLPGLWHWYQVTLMFQIIIQMCSIHNSDLSRVPSVHIKKEKSIHESEDYYKERDRC